MFQNYFEMGFQHVLVPTFNKDFFTSQNKQIKAEKNILRKRK